MSNRRKPASVVEINEIDLAWVAGLLEGEGSFCIAKKKDRPSNYPIITCNMTDLDVIERLRGITGVGSIVSIQPPGNTKRQYRWRVARHNDCFVLAGLLYPYMGTRRRKQIEELLKLDV